MDFTNQIAEITWGFDCWETLAAVPAGEPLCFLGGQDSKFAFLALDFSPVPFSEFSKLELSGPKVGGEWPFVSGYIGVFAYNDSPYEPRSPSRVFRVYAGLLFSLADKKVYLTGNPAEPRGSCQIRLQDLKPVKHTSSLEPLAPFDLVPLNPVEDYLDSVASAVEDIRNGRYYQINILRYFDVLNCPQAICRRLRRYAGPFGMWMRWPDTAEVISFSPERFFALSAHGATHYLRSQPIKGTIPRSCDSPDSKSKLLKSRKDLAELRMIVDLVRSDMMGVCQPHSVKVIEDVGLVHYPTITHLQGTIEGKLRPGLKFERILAAMCPGGSITGAPKTEVIQAIAEYERRSRGLFMGSCFWYDPNLGNFDSSILIRTLTKDPHQSRFSYAAGSGITLGSDPFRELAETEAKCQVVVSP